MVQSGQYLRSYRSPALLPSPAVFDPPYRYRNQVKELYDMQRVPMFLWFGAPSRPRYLTNKRIEYQTRPELVG